MKQIFTEQEQIEELAGMKELSCSCDKCVKMCKTAPCLGTPSEILRLINAGHKANIVGTLFVAGLKYGIPPIDMIQLEYDEDKRQCVMLTDEGKCSLHDSGLKPLEGKLADCRITAMPPGKFPPAWCVAFTWTFPANRNIIRLIRKALEK